MLRYDNGNTNPERPPQTIWFPAEAHAVVARVCSGAPVPVPGHLPVALLLQQQQHPDPSPVSSARVRSPKVLRLGIPGACWPQKQARL